MDMTDKSADLRSKEKGEMKNKIIIFDDKKYTSPAEIPGTGIVFSASKKTECFNPVMEIPDSNDIADVIEMAEKIADTYTEGFDLEIRTTLMIKLLYVRFSKSIPSEKKNYDYATALKLENLNIDCVHDNGKKWSGMNTFIHGMTM